MFNKSILKKHAKAQYGHAPEEALFKGIVYTCNRVAMAVNEQMDRGHDFMEVYMFSLVFCSDDFAEYPVKGDRMIFEGIEYRVISSELAPLSLDLKVHLKTIGGK